MINNRARDKIVKIAMKPIADRLSQRAYGEMVENICKAQCGQCPDGWWLCDNAKRVHRRFTAFLFEFYARHN